MASTGSNAKAAKGVGVTNLYFAISMSDKICISTGNNAHW